MSKHAAAQKKSTHKSFEWAVTVGFVATLLGLVDTLLGLATPLSATRRTSWGLDQAHQVARRTPPKRASWRPLDQQRN